MRRVLTTGVTLIELTVAVLLVGLLALSFALSVVPVTEGVLLARRHGDAAQKAQLAVGRMVRELTAVTNVVSGTAQAFVYDTVDISGAGHRRTLSWSAGNPLLLDGVALSDDVLSFQIRYSATPGAAAQSAWTPPARLLEFVLQSASDPFMMYTNRVFLRYP